MLKRLMFNIKFNAYVDITNNCNLRCRHCYHKNSLNHGEEVPLPEWKKRFEQYRRQGIRHIVLTGGEPTLRMDVIMLAQEYFPFLAAFTNGQKKIPDEFRNRIFVSFDGLEEAHDNIRGKGSFETAVKNYTNDKRVVANCVLSKENYRGPKNLRKFLDFIKYDLKVKGVIVGYFCPEKNNQNDYNILLYKKQREEIGAVINEELNKKDNIVFSTKDLNKSQVNDCFPRPCHMKEVCWFYTASGSTKMNLSERADCDRCMFIGRYSVSPWRIVERLRYGIMIQRCLLDIS